MKALSRVLLLLLGGYAATLHADATLEFQLTDAAGESRAFTVRIVGRWARIDDPASEVDFSLYDSGRRKLIAVDNASQSYRIIPLATNLEGVPGTVPVRLRPTKEMTSVADYRCRLVEEALDEATTLEHCMANAAGLDMTQREVITLRRVFQAARQLDWSWLGAGTEDERFVAIRSRQPDGSAQLELQSIARGPVDDPSMRVPGNFTERGSSLGQRRHVRSPSRGADSAATPSTAPASPPSTEAAR